MRADLEYCNAYNRLICNQKSTIEARWERFQNTELLKSDQLCSLVGRDSPALILLTMPMKSLEEDEYFSNAHPRNRFWSS